MAQIKAPEDIVTMLQNLTLTDKERFDLHRRLANKTRKFFRGQITAQRDIDGKPFAPRKRRKTGYVDKKTGKFIRRGNLEQRGNMLMGFSRMLKTQVGKDGFAVGVASFAEIAKRHNEGKAITFSTRIKGWFNSKTNKWEGGRKAQLSYRMPKRTFIGWTKELEVMIAHDIYQKMEPK